MYMYLYSLLDAFKNIDRDEFLEAEDKGDTPPNPSKVSTFTFTFTLPYTFVYCVILLNILTLI